MAATSPAAHTGNAGNCSKTSTWKATRGRPRPAYQDGDALWEKVCELGLEGVVAKKRAGHYLPGRRGWIKTKNRAYWRYPLEASAARPFGHSPGR